MALVGRLREMRQRAGRVAAMIAAAAVLPGCGMLLGLDSFKEGAGTTGTSSTSSGSTSAGGGASSSSASSGGGGGESSGPQIVKSFPADGDMQASLAPYALLYFNEPVSAASATGKIKVSSDATPDAVFVQVYPCPDNDPTCIAAVFPDSFVGSATNGVKSLAGATKYTVTVDKSFSGSSGKTNPSDLSISYTTFKYTLNLFDDSGAIPSDAGGLDYDPVSQAIFVCGPSSNSKAVLLRKINMQNGTPQSAVTFSQPDTSQTGGPECYGLDIYDGTLYASGSYSESVFVYKDLKVNSQPLPDVILNTTTLPAPNDQIDQVHAVAVLNQGAQVFFGLGEYTGGGTMATGVLKLDAPAQSWSVWLPAINLFIPSQGFTVTRGYDAQKNAYIYVASRNKIFKVRASDASIVNTQTLADDLGDPQLRTDSAGRLYLADYSSDGIFTVFDTSGSQGFKTIATRNGLPLGRFGLNEQGKDVTVYFMSFRYKATIGMMTISF